MDTSTQLPLLCIARLGLRVLGIIQERERLDQLDADSPTHVHGHSVGGTNPSLLCAIGGATSVPADEVEFNREVVGGDGGHFGGPRTRRRLFDDAERGASPRPCESGSARSDGRVNGRELSMQWLYR